MNLGLVDAATKAQRQLRDLRQVRGPGLQLEEKGMPIGRH